MANKDNENEIEIDLPDGEKAYILEVEWRGKKRIFVDTTSAKYPAFTVTDDESAKDTLTYNQYTLWNEILRKIK